MRVYNKSGNIWENIGHLPITVLEEDLEEIPYDSSLSDLLKNYEDYCEKLEERKEKKEKENEEDERRVWRKFEKEMNQKFFKIYSAW